MSFQLAERRKTKLRLALSGPSGSGKTLSALLIAYGLCGDWSKIALADTENDRSLAYVGRAEEEWQTGRFLHQTLFPPYTVQSFINAMNEAVQAGAEVVILDSLSHAWMGEGGILEYVDSRTRQSSSKNSFNAWGGPQGGTAEQRRLIEHIMACPIHVICTMRVKTEWVIEEDSRGKKVPRKVGQAAVQRGDLEYEFDVAFEISNDGHYAMVGKDTTGLFDGRTFKPTPEIGERYIAWAAGGVDAPRPVAPAPPDPAQAPLGPEAWAAMVAAAAQFGATPEQLLTHAAQYQHQGPGEAMPRGLAEYVFTTARSAAEAARLAVQDQQREQAAAAPHAPAPAAAQPQPAPSPPAGATQPVPEPVPAPHAPASGEVISLSQAGNLRAMLHAKGYREEAVTGPLGIASIDVLPAARWDEVVAAVRSLPDPTPPQPAPSQMPQAPAPQGAARFPEGSEAAQQAEARAAERPDGCTMDTSYMRCTAIARGETPQCEGCEHFDPAWAPLDAATRRDAAPEHAPWGTVTKAGSIDADRLKKLAIKCGELEQLGVPTEAWREVMWREEKVTSRRELSKAAADRMLKYLARWTTDVASGSVAPTETAA